MVREVCIGVGLGWVWRMVGTRNVGGRIRIFWRCIRKEIGRGRSFFSEGGYVWRVLRVRDGFLGLRWIVSGVIG